MVLEELVLSTRSNECHIKKKEKEKKKSKKKDLMICLSIYLITEIG